MDFLAEQDDIEEGSEEDIDDDEEDESGESGNEMDEDDYDDDVDSGSDDTLVNGQGNFQMNNLDNGNEIESEDDDDSIIVFGRKKGDKLKNKRKLDVIDEEKKIECSKDIEKVYDEFEDGLCMGFEIDKKSKNNEAFDQVKYRILVNKIGIDSLVLDNSDVTQDRVSRAIPYVKNEKGVMVPKYNVKNRALLPAVISLLDFAEAETRIRLGNQKKYYVFKKDEVTGSYKLFKVDTAEKDDIFLEKGDRFIEVQGEVFNMNYGAFIDSKGNIHMNFSTKEVNIPIGDAWQGFKNACCYVTNKIFSLFKKKKDVKNIKNYNNKKIIKI